MLFDELAEGRFFIRALKSSEGGVIASEPEVYIKTSRTMAFNMTTRDKVRIRPKEFVYALRGISCVF